MLSLTTGHQPLATDPRDRDNPVLVDLERLLIVRLRNLGDCVLMTPVLETLKRWRPRLEISLLVELPFVPVFSANPHVARTLVLRSGGSAVAKYRDRLRMVRKLREESFDLVWNLHGGSTSLLLTMSPRARATLGFEHYRNAGRYTHRAPSASSIWNTSDVHTVETQAAPLRWLGVPVDRESLTPRVYVLPEASRRVAEFLAESGLDGKPFVLVQPTATLATKQWAEDRFGELIRRIRARYGLATVLAAGPGEEGVASRTAAAADSSPPLFCGRGLEELKALMARATIYVGNDSGPMHLAAALGRPVVAVFGSSNFAAWRPWGTGFEGVRADLPCIPCPGYRCYEFERPRCIESISVDAVLSAFEHLMQRQPVLLPCEK